MPDSKTNPSTSADDLSPMMQQYVTMKEQCGDAILLFRCGDFYEMFMDDAVRGAEALDIALTKRQSGKGKTVPLAGIPYHAAQSYIYKLTRQGFRVAVCEQMEPPTKGKQIVRREVVRTISPGAIIDSDVIDSKENNYLAAIHDGGIAGWGLASIDVTTGEFRCTYESGPEGWRSILAELATIQPSELLLESDSLNNEELRRQIRSMCDCMCTGVRAETFSPEGVQSFGIDDGESPEAKGKPEYDIPSQAASAILHYLNDHQKETLGFIRVLIHYTRSEYLIIDKNTERNLELIASSGDGGKKHSLLGVLDQTVTPMGGRLLRQWILRPLLSSRHINRRLDAIASLVENPNARESIREQLRSINDLERVMGRVTFGNANARDLAGLCVSLEQIPVLNNILLALDSSRVLKQVLRSETDVLPPVEEEHIDTVMEVREVLQTALHDEPPLSVREGGMIRDGYEPELDELRAIRRDGRGYIARLQEQERKSTGITSLKVAYNKVFGYYIEVTHTHKDKVPDSYIRKQTLTSAERYITPELKEFEAKVLHAEDRIRELEFQILQKLLEIVKGYSPRLLASAKAIAHLDCIHSLAEIASRYQYNRPVVNDSRTLTIEEGRHPVLERAAVVDQFVPNDCAFDQDEQVLIITGPNMAGKSTYIRQVALITLMAQMGSFVPARSATVGIIDRLFSRVGASDDLARGRSTFMVEMNEAAHILTSATPKSLVILDEIGRGTSTFDGVSLAWAIVEYLHGIRGKGVKTLFATHYHELAALEELLSRVVNYHVQVSERDGNISFLYRIGRGYTDHSYGIHVADLAGVPKRVTERARKILSRLERGEHLSAQAAAHPDGDFQISLFSMMDEPLRARLADIDVNTLSPMEALHLLSELVSEAQGK